MPKNLRELLAQLDAEGITDYRRYRQVRQYMSFKARETNTPISGSFELTPLCNLDCKMCYVHLNKEQMHGAELLPTETWKDIMRQAFDAGMMYATLTGGECLTYPGFKELFLYLKDMGVEVNVLTNGLLIDADMANFFKQHSPAATQITLYGACEDAYERVTGHRFFGKVLTNIRRLRDLGIPVIAAITPNAFMTDGTEIVQLLHDEGIHFNINSGIIAPREETGREVSDTDAGTYVAMLKLKRRLEGAEECFGCDPDSMPDPPTVRSDSPKGVRCGAGRSTFSVNWHGLMTPCNSFPCEGADVLKLGFNESWHRVNQIALNFPRPAECEGCYYENACKHCVVEHASKAEVGHASRDVCAWGMRMVAEGLLKP